MKKIKVLHISEPFAAGVYNYIREICGVLDRYNQFETYVIYSPQRNGTDMQKIAKDFSSRTSLIQVPMSREISIKNDLTAIIALRKLIKEIKPDIIHLHSSKASILGRVATYFSSKAALYYTPNGYSFLRQDISNGKKKFFYGIEKWVARIFGGTTIACGDTEFLHAQKIGKSLLVRNGVHVNEISKSTKETDESSNKFTIGTMGRLSPQKNPLLFDQIAKKLPSFDFVWIGDGKLKYDLKSENITVTGWKTHQEALELVNTFDIYIQTSLWEGLPFTIIESMALSKPVLATNVVGNKDAVEHNYNGYLGETAEQFIGFIENLHSNPEQLEQFGKNSLIRAHELFDKDKNFETLIEIYSKSVS
ncbi:MAG: glycosyltransferase [Bacteroidota bacterium]